MENCENFRHATHAQNDTPVDTPSIPRALARVANVRPSAICLQQTTRVVPVLCLRRKFVGCFSSSRGATGVCVESLLGTRGHREEGSPGTFQIRTESQRGRFDTRNPRRGFIGHFTNLHGATARALGRAGSLQRVHRALSKFARRRSEG